MQWEKLVASNSAHQNRKKYNQKISTQTKNGTPKDAA